MRTERGNRSSKWIARAALALGVLAAGCAGGGAHVVPNYKPLSLFTVSFVGGCADSVNIDPTLRNCPPQDGVAPADCVRVKRGDKVKFEASPLVDSNGNPNDFVLQFETPFQSTPSTTLDSTSGVVADLPTRQNQKGGKPYTFIVTTKNPPPSGCKPIDKQIILD